MNCLGESGEAIMGMPCKQLYQAEPGMVRDVIHSNYFKEMSILVRASMNQGYGGGDSSIRYNLSRVLNTTMQESNQSLLKKLDTYRNM